MVKSALGLLTSTIALLSASNAPAEEFRCYFTEPFVSVKYNSATKYLVTSALADAKESGDGSFVPQPKFQMGVTMNTAADGTITWVNSKGVTIFTLALSNNGSNGMSNVIYPYDITANSSLSLPKDGLGGCESESKPAIR